MADTGCTVTILSARLAAANQLRVRKTTNVQLKAANSRKIHINMTDNSRPFKTLIARRVPLRFEDEANKTINHLIAKGVITPCLLYTSDAADE